MVKSADSRMRKYTAKFDSTVIATRYTAGKDLATVSFNASAGAAVALESMIKQLVEPKVASPLQLPFYLSFARELAAKAAKYGGLTLYNEAQAAYLKWTGRGLDTTICTDIMKAVGVETALYGT